MSLPRALTEDARLECDHRAKLENAPSQSWVRIDGKRLLVAKDPEGRRIHGCPNISPATRPCITSLVVIEGYSAFVSIDGHALCLQSIEGLTDGTPPGGVHYVVRDPGQVFVGVSA